MKTINKKLLDATQLEYLAEAEELQQELIKQGFMATRIEKEPEDRCTFHVVYFDGTKSYKIKRNWDNNVVVMGDEWFSYPHVSSSRRAEVYAKYKGQNMKVITERKLQQKIDDENSIQKELDTLEAEAIKKHNDFIVSLDGLNVKFDKENKNGSIIKNGIEFSFELCQDGYVSKKLSLHYAVDNSIEAFKKLSDNKY